jgi:hypothetical protein
MGLATGATYLFAIFVCPRFTRKLMMIFSITSVKYFMDDKGKDDDKKDKNPLPQKQAYMPGIAEF